MYRTICSISREEMESAMRDSGMHRIEACHPDKPDKHCRSDKWQGDLLSFALRIVQQVEERGKEGKLQW